MTACAGTPEPPPSDPYEECAHPGYPERPYTDKKVGLLIGKQAAAIEKCRGLLGHDVDPSVLGKLESEPVEETDLDAAEDPATGDIVGDMAKDRRPVRPFVDEIQ